MYRSSGIISGFTNVKELYQKIAECYDMPATDVSYLKFITILFFVIDIPPLDPVLHTEHSQSGHEQLTRRSNWP